MICRISGTLESIHELTATIALAGGGVGDVAYEVLLPAFIAERLGNKPAGPITLVTRHYLESQGQGNSFIPRLIGFTALRERDFFELFTTVKGIGNRKALRAMAIEPALIAAAIAQRDARSLTKLPEIGKRMAETIIAELSGKVDGYLGGAEVARLESGAVPLPADPVTDDAVLTLMALGETRPDAERLVLRAIDRAKRESRDVESPQALVEFVFAIRNAAPTAR